MGDSPGDTFRGHHMYEPSFSQDDMNNSEPWVFGNDRSYGENNLFGHGADHEDLGLAIPDLPQESTLHVESSIITADDITDLDVPGIQAINEALGQSSHYLNAQSVRGPTPHNQQFLHMYSSHQMTEPLKNTVAPMLLHHEWPEIDGGESSLHSPTSTAVSHFEQHRPQNVRRAKQRVRRENCPTVFMQTKDLSQKLCTACFKHPSRAKKPDGRSERWLKMSAPQGDQSPGPLNALSSPSGCRTISVYTSGVRTYEEAVNLLHPFEEGLILENEKVPATAQEVDDVVQRLVDAICTTYTGNDSWLLRKQANFAEKTFAPSDVDEDRYIIAKIRLLVRDTIVLHRGGIFSWPIGGQTAGYRANRALEFTHRISRMETYLAENKLIAENVINGRRVDEFIGNPDRYDKEIRECRKNNVRKAQKEAELRGTSTATSTAPTTPRKRTFSSIFSPQESIEEPASRELRSLEAVPQEHTVFRIEPDLPRTRSGRAEPCLALPPQAMVSLRHHDEND